MSCLENFTAEEILSNHKKQCLLINGCQAVNNKSGIIKFTNHNKQIPILFKIYTNRECLLKRVSILTKVNIKYQERNPNSTGVKSVCSDDRFTLPSIILTGKDCINKCLTWVLDKQRWTKQIAKQYFNRR